MAFPYPKSFRFLYQLMTFVLIVGLAFPNGGIANAQDDVNPGGTVEVTEEPTLPPVETEEPPTAEPPPVDQYTLAIETIGNGSVSLSPDQDTYSANTVVSLLANADDGWEFNGWSGDLEGDENPANVEMLADLTITATFTEIPPPVEDIPVITVSGSLAEFSASPGIPSDEQSYEVSAKYLSDPLILMAPDGFEISTFSGGGFGPSVSLAPQKGTVSSTTIFVRLIRETTGSASGKILHNSTGAQAVELDVSGVVTKPSAKIKAESDPIVYLGPIGSVTANATGTSLVLPVTVGVPAGNTVIVGFASRGANPYTPVPSLVDSAGNTYTLVIYSLTYQHGRVYLFYSHLTNPLAIGNTITITSPSVLSRVAIASAFSGLLTSAPDQTLAYPPTSSTTTNSGNNISVGPTAATTQADELLIGMIGTEEATDATNGTWLNDFIAGPNIKTSGATNEWRVSMGYKVVSATGTYTAAKTVTNAPYWAATIATFKAAGTDTTAPTVTINQAASQVDPTVLSPIHFTVVFSEPVTNFATGDVSLSGTAGATTATVTGSGTTYDVAVTGMTTSGTVIASLEAGIASDAANNPSAASTSTDNSVTFNLDNTPPSVTVEQAASQVDPTGLTSIKFSILFSEPVTDFVAADVSLSGSAGANAVELTGSGTTYEATVSGMTGSGTVIASVAAGVAHDESGNPNLISSSLDNTVTYQYVAPQIEFVKNIGTVAVNAEGTTLDLPVGAGGVDAGDTIIIGFASRGSSTYTDPTITDSAGNTYHQATLSITYSHGRSYIFYAYVASALESGDVITITTASVPSRIAVASVFSGIVATDPLDQALGFPTASPASQGNSPSVGPTGTTTQGQEVVIGVIGTEEATDAGIGTWLNSFVTGPQIKTSGATNEWRVSLGYKLVTSPGQFTAAKTVTNNPYWAATIATFKAGEPLPTCYTLTLSHTGEGADPIATPGNSTGCASGQYVAGEVISLSEALPDSGWQISGWTGTSVNGSTETTNQLTMPSADHSASVIYTEIGPTCYDLALSHTGNGTTPDALPINSVGCDVGTYTAGQVIALSGAVPDSGWQIASWTGTSDDTSVGATNSVTMPASDHSVSVNYTEVLPTCHSLTISHTGDGTDPVASLPNSTGCAAGLYLAGEIINLSGATPGLGYEITGWTGSDDDTSVMPTNVLTMPSRKSLPLGGLYPDRIFPHHHE